METAYQPGIEQVQAGHVVHKSKSGVLLKMLGQVDRRSQIPLMTGAGAVRTVGSRILTVCVFADVHLQIAVGTRQPPLRNYFPVCEQFNTVSSTAHLVG